LNDPRLGTVDKSISCETCNSNCVECVGHFGHIELTKPVFHVGYMEEIKKIMRCICFNCSQLLITKGPKYKEILRIKNPKKRQMLMVNISKGIKICKMKERNFDVIILLLKLLFIP